MIVRVELVAGATFTNAVIDMAKLAEHLSRCGAIVLVEANFNGATLTISEMATPESAHVQYDGQKEDVQR